MTSLEAFGMLACYEDEGRLKLPPIMETSPDGQLVDVALPRFVAWASVSGWLAIATHMGELIVAVERGVASYEAGRITEQDVLSETWAVIDEVMRVGQYHEASLN